MVNTPTRSCFLRFSPALSVDDLKKVRDNVSAIVLDGDRLWLGGDEGTAIHRMTREATGDFSDHKTFELKESLNLPGPAKEEIDIEGLDIDGDALWLIGSHSAKRKKADESKSLEENMERLAKVEAEGNRFTLGRVPLDGAGTPLFDQAIRLQGDATANLLTKALTGDPHVGPFVPRVSESIVGGAPRKVVEGVPSKDNGFDIEGLAVSGDRVFVGLRGPVVRGWAGIIELQVRAAPDRTLTLDGIGASGRPYHKHLLQLDGLGIRELAIHGDDLLVLAGPSMVLDGPVFIYRWKDALNLHADSLTWNKALVKVVTVPFGTTKDHAEGLSIMTEDPLSVMVCYDSPADSRLEGHGVKVDVFAIEG